MQDENQSNSIGDPQPVDPGQVAHFLVRAGTVIAITASSLVAFSLLLTPKRLAGATCSSKLKWQERQRELQQTNAAPSATAPDKDKAPERP